MDRDAMVIDADRFFEPGGESGEVAFLQQAAVSVGPFDDFAGDIAAVEAVTSGVNRGLAPAVFGTGLGIEQAPEKMGLRRVFDYVAWAGNFAVGHIEGRAGRPFRAEF